MSANELQQSLLDSMQLLSEKAIQNTDSVITIKATIKEIVDAGLGTYLVKYGENTFEAISLGKVAYQENNIVYVLIPNGDFAQQKMILGAVTPHATMYASTEENENYIPISDNLFGGGVGINLRSWKDEVKNVDIDTTNFGLIFSEYLKNYKNFVFTAKVKTEIDKDHQVKGNYGLVLNLPFIDAAAGGTSVQTWKSYPMDVTTMQGNPYAYDVAQLINIYYEIDDTSKYDVSRQPYITAFTTDFGYTEDRLDIDYDIHFTDIGIKIIDILSESEKSGYYLSVSASQGNYFLGNHYDSSKILTPALKLNGKDTSYKGWECYWFVADSSIDTASDGYSIIGGLGWKCLNKKQNVTYDSTGKQSFEYVTNNYSYSVSVDDVISSLKYNVY